MRNNGILYAISAYIIWGLFPIYWKWLQAVPAPELLAHRIAWSFILLVILLAATRQWKSFQTAALNAKTLRIYLAAALLIGINWFTYVWAVNAKFIVEASLGYFINPLFSVLLGVFFLKERLRPLQWLPIGLAAAGVLYLGLEYGRLPWIALTLATSFGLYGLVKKTAPLNSLFGVALETGILFLPALAYLMTQEINAQAAFLHNGPRIDLLLAGAGVVTTVPLLLFASATRRIPLSTVGILQYVTPTLQFLLGILVYKEPFNITLGIGFGIVWLALLLFGAEGWQAHRATLTEPIPELGEG